MTLCDKCKVEESTHKLGENDQHNLCSDCIGLWVKFINKDKRIDTDFYKKEFHSIWEKVYRDFINKKGKEVVQFT